MLGKIAKFDAAASPPFLLAVNNAPGNTYAMRYGAILAYAQVEHPTFGSFCLPDTMPEEPSPDDTSSFAVVVADDVGAVARDAASEHKTSSPLPPLTSRANLASNDSSGDFRAKISCHTTP